MTDEIEIVTNEMVKAFTSEARRLLALFPDPVWAGTDEKTDDQHVADYAETLVKTRDIDLPDATAMNMVDSEIGILAFTGNTPNAADRARAIVGFIRNMPFLLDSVEELIELRRIHSKRVSELIEHNTAQLLENRAQRATIRSLLMRDQWMLNQIHEHIAITETEMPEVE